MHNRVCLALWLLAWPLLAAERKLDFFELREGQTPPGYRSTVTGEGKPGEWRIVLDAVPPLGGGAPAEGKRPVLAQLSQEAKDEHFPLLIHEGETFGDFKLTTRFKTVSGALEQMAGIAFRIQNESNYYVVRASSIGSTFRFYKILNGERGPLVGPELPVASNVWHELSVECKGNDIRCGLDGKELISVTDKVNAFASGRVGFWTKSDSVSYFTDTKISFTPFEPPALALVRDVGKRYPRLVGLKVYVRGKEPNTTRMVASREAKEVGEPGGKTEQEVLSHGETYYGRDKGTVSVIMPLRDRNGDAIAAVRVVMKAFPGQTEETAIIRAAPIVKEIQGKVGSLEDLTE